MRKPMAVAAALALPVLFPAAALADAHDGAETYVAQLGALNSSGASGTAEVTLEGDQLTVMVTASGLLADQPHAQHIHYPEEGEGSCPTGDADEDGDGFVNTSEGAPFYGGIVVSLTTEGDVTPDSGLAIDRFPTAPGGEVMYERTFTVPEGFDAAEDLTESVIVVHGIDANDNGEYDMDGAGASDLDESLPAEATNPALCGALSPAGEGGVPSGLGGSNGIENSALMLAGAGSIAAAAGVVLYSRRRSTQA
ncbi:hypothetical protein [Ornithinimicrobium sediminis]|uniref:hypothetical protein n=1 Tax=Ornithinimicrobium sediminis TaxID=2904603 RepID=UPI001E5F8C8D|nr:hypothetical protein [Ornithinimicrobium sediminis]MCE0488149.1 hypothetical protein [Ornithinimicrobium sediminis]